MGSVYAWFWTYWGVLVTGIVVGLVTTGIGAYFKEEQYTDTGLLAFGAVIFIGTVLYSIIWAIVGPFSVHWILIPVGLIGIIMFIAGKQEYEDEPVRGSIFIFVAIGLAYLVTYNDAVRAAVAPAAFLAQQGATPQNEAGLQSATTTPKSIPATSAATPVGNTQAPADSGAMFTKGDDGWWHVSRGGGSVNDPGGGLSRVNVHDFWPAAAVQARQGFLVTADGTPIRVLASGYLVPLFETPETAFPGGVVDIMKPFRAYYVIRKQDTSLLVAEPPFTPQSRTFWARQGDCYVWATGLAAEMMGNLQVFAGEEKARAGSEPLAPSDKYISTQRLPSIPGAEGLPPMSKLPLLMRTGELAALLCPANGGQMCWVNVAKAGDSFALSNVQ